MAAVETYVYGILRAGGEEVPSVHGVSRLSAPVRVVTEGTLSALVSDVPAGELLATRGDIYRHSEILQLLMRSGTVLPMRFGTVMPDEHTVVSDLLEARKSQLEGLLQTLQGRVELTLKATYRESVFREVVAENPSIEALNRRVRGNSPDASYYDRIRLGELVAAALESKRTRDAEALLERLEPLAADVRVGEPVHERSVLHAAFLVEERALESFDVAADALAARHAERLRFSYTGPVPPYSFVELSGGSTWG